jgi:serine kinase of HPr protein (carbohydrate metabolism regulator)
MQVHATCVALEPAGEPVGILLRGPSGAGKSDLALRLIDAGAALVGDDRIDLARSGPDVVARGAPTLFGLLEVRGVGVVEVGAIAAAPVRLVVDCLTGDAAAPRLPTDSMVDLLGVQVPVLQLRAPEASAPAKVRLAVKAHRLQLLRTDTGAAR